MPNIGAMDDQLLAKIDELNKNILALIEELQQSRIANNPAPYTPHWMPTVGPIFGTTQTIEDADILLG